MNDGKLMLCHVPCDLALAGEIERGAEEVEAFLKRDLPAGRVLLINNSGFGSYGPFPEPNRTQQLEMLDVNLRAMVDLTARLLPALRARGGVVMNIASTAAFQPTPFMATYGASKAFVLHWTLALNEEWRGSGLRAMVVCPGPTVTRFSLRAGLKTGNVPNTPGMPADAVALAALRGLAAGRSVVVPGWRNALSAVAASCVPKRLAARVAAQVIRRSRLQKAPR